MCTLNLILSCACCLARFDHKLGLPYFIPSLIFGAVLMVGLLFLELIHPWKSDVQVSLSPHAVYALCQS